MESRNSDGHVARHPLSSIIGRIVLLFLLVPPIFVGTGLAPMNPQLAVTTNSLGSTFTWETDVGGNSLDPHVATCFFYIDCTIAKNVYETLLWYNGTNSGEVIPWLAKEYTPSPDGRSIQFTLRDGISFADGDPLNSTAVYFSLNRLVLEGSDGGFLCCDFQNDYTVNWVEGLLAQNLVEITGPLTFKLNVLHPDGGLVYALATPYAAIVDPQFVMSRDLALWEGPNSTAALPYTTLDGSMMERTSQYLKDEAYACSRTETTNGCKISYLGTSKDGSLAGTGPYTITSASADLTRVLLSARSDYWGGPNQFRGGQKIAPHFNAVNAKEVPVEFDRIQDLNNAAARGEAMSVVVNNDQLYSLANRTVWQTKGTLQSALMNVSLYGPYKIGGVNAASISFVMNVSDASTGQFFQFQPFADRRLRLAFADAVDIGLTNRDHNDNMGQIAKNFITPDSVPTGSYNGAIVPYYSFSLNKVQSLLLDAMESPLTSFRFFNGTIAPRGLFNNTFGCPVLNAENKCDKAVTRTVTLAYFTEVGGLSDINNEVIRKMAIAINNVSDTYRMGLHVAIEALPYDLMQHLGFGGNLYTFEYFSGGDSPWVGRAFSDTLLEPSHGFCNTDLPSCFNPSDDGWNSTRKNQLYAAFLKASSEINVSAIVSLSNQLMELENRAVTHVWTIYPYFFVPVTSNVQGFYYNPYIQGMYFASLYYSQPPVQGSFLSQLLGDWPFLFLLVVAASSILLIGVFVLRSSGGRKSSDKSAAEVSLIGKPQASIRDEPGGRGFNVQIVANVPGEVEVGQVIRLKLDLVNTGGGVAALHKVEGLVPAGLTLDRSNQAPGDTSIGDFQTDGSVLLHGNRLRPSEIRSIQYDVKASKEGEIEFVAKVSYSDEKGAMSTSTSTSRLTIRPPFEFEFKTERGKTLFEFLISAFIHDYMERKYPVDKAGWRSLVEVAQATKIPIPTLYGREGGVGPNLQELTSRGLVETRIFPGERGRGGQIMRARVAYERDPVKEIISRRVRIKK